RLRSMTLEVTVAGGDRPLAVLAKRPLRHENLATEAAPQQVADVVPDDRGGDADRDHQLDLELALACQHCRQDECGLPRRGDAHRLETDDRGQQVAEAVRDPEDRCERASQACWPR